MRRVMGRKGDRKHGGPSSRKASQEMPGKPIKDHNSFEQASFIRKQVDPETAKYFTEIANVLETQDGVDVEERPFVCGNALEEARGKEVELATDHIISYTLQILLEGCDSDHLCRFLRSCAKDFARISTDRCGSHVAETALNCLNVHLQDEDIYTSAKESLTLICQAMVINPADVICNCYGSHVVRSLLCLCKGVPLDSEVHASKSSTVLARRLNLKEDKNNAKDPPQVHQGFPDLLKFIVSGLLKGNQTDIAILQADQCSSLVLQTALRLLTGQDQELLSVIPAILGSNVDNLAEGNLIQLTEVQHIRDLIKENAFSHLMEIILEVSPEVLYAEIFTMIFKNSLFELSCDPSANFAVQALISYARSQSHIEAIWEELGSKFKDLLENGRSGVVASIVAASQRLQTHEHKCAKALASAVSSANESTKEIVPRLLYLENYLYSEDKTNWRWPRGCRVNVMGSLILQTIFKYPNQYIQPYIASLTSMENADVLEVAKDGGGARVVECFLTSAAPDKQKGKLVDKLKGHFAELAMHPSGSFTIEKCFSASDVPLREAIVSELVSIQRDISKMKQGPVLIRSLDVDGYARRPEQWKSRQKSKISACRNFLAEFDLDRSSKGPCKKNKSFFPDNSNKASQQTDLKKMRLEIEQSLASFAPNDKKEKKRKRKDDKGKSSQKKSKT